MDWLEELLAAVRRAEPIPCAGCGRPWPRADMLESYVPSRVVRFDGIAEPFDLTVSSLAWVGPCCAVLANDWQP